ncbi:MAG: hypothetical protein V1857_00800 [archaeon]
MAKGVRKTVLMANQIPASQPMGWEDTLVLEAYEKYPQQIIPFLSTPRWGWQIRDQAFMVYAESQLKTGKFKGIGEFMVRHYACGGLAPAPDINVPADSQWMQDMMRLGAKYNVPLNIHMETEPDTVAALDRALMANANTTVIWAHQNPVKTSGGAEAQYARTADPNQIAALLDKYPNLFADISVGKESDFFDPAKDLTLPDNWKSLYEKYNDRFVVGFDNAAKEMFEKYYQSRVTVHRTWLSQLTSATARKLAYENIERILGLPPTTAANANPTTATGFYENNPSYAAIGIAPVVTFPLLIRRILETTPKWN